ncbi:MAG: T9SS type A sorting domain-containing protein [Candidatus Paceibacterota bacterium]|jgi:hypothetical protein
MKKMLILAIFTIAISVAKAQSQSSIIIDSIPDKKVGADSVIAYFYYSAPTLSKICFSVTGGSSPQASDTLWARGIGYASRVVRNLDANTFYTGVATITDSLGRSSYDIYPFTTKLADIKPFFTGAIYGTSSNDTVTLKASHNAGFSAFLYFRYSVNGGTMVFSPDQPVSGIGIASYIITGVPRGATVVSKPYIYNDLGITPGAFDTVTTAPAGLPIGSLKGLITTGTDTARIRISSDNNGGGQTNIWIGYDTLSAASALNSNVIQMNANGDTAIVLRSLLPGKTYYYNIYLNNVIGTTKIDVSTFLTKAVSSPPQALTFYPDNITKTGAVFKGSRSNQTETRFCYGKKGQGLTLKTTWFVQSSPGNYNVVCTTLTAQSDYEVAIEAKNAGGVSVLGAVVEFRTLDSSAVSDNVPIAITVVPDPISITETGAIARGKFDPKDFASTAWIEYGTDTLCSNILKPIQSFAASNTTIDFLGMMNGLQPGTKYYYRLIVDNGQGIGRGLVEEFTTKSLPLGIKDHIKTVSINAYPNPWRKRLTITTPLEMVNGKVVVIDILGREATHEVFTGKTCVLSRDGIPSGTYIIHVYDDGDNQISNTKVIIE